MAQLPNALGMLLAQLAVIEEKTGNVTLVNTFQEITFARFPSPPTPLVAYSVLTDGLGDVRLSLLVTRCDTLDEIYLRSSEMKFGNPLQRIRVRWHVRSCSFPAPGAYEFALHANGEVISHSIVSVLMKGAPQ